MNESPTLPTQITFTDGFASRRPIKKHQRRSGQWKHRNQPNAIEKKWQSRVHSIGLALKSLTISGYPFHRPARFRGCGKTR